MLATDFGQLARYQAANQLLPPPSPTEPRVIFYGDSITDGWKLDQYFPGKGYINRGISGQTTPQMLVRFRQDVIDLEPKVLVVLAGTNDLAGNTGPETVEQIEANYATLAELARLHHIALVYSSVMPVSDYVHPEMTHGRPPEKILALNAWLKQYCRDNNLIYLDYFSAMVDPSGQLQKPLSGDGLHPNDAGYRVMTPLALKAIAAALAQPGLSPQ
jgi:lysophospholipase L1-like esterase